MVTRYFALCSNAEGFFLSEKGGGRLKMEKKKNQSACCERCTFYVYDEEYDYYVCEADLDEDEMSAFLRGSDFSCPFYQLEDEYKVVRKQM